MIESRERSSARRRSRAGRHVGESAPSFEGSFRALGTLAYEGAAVSAHVTDAASGATLLAIDDRVALPTASVGMVLLLAEVSARLTAEGGGAFGIVDKDSAARVGESGLWQHLRVPALPVVDLAALIGATNDNLATNLLLDRVGLDAVRSRAESLGLSRTALLDRARDDRGPDDAPQFSVGSTAELAGLFAALARGEAVDRVTSERVLDWLSLGSDLSMVASAFGLDPLAHRGTDHGLRLVNTTGTDAGVRSEVGTLSGPRGRVAYAVTVQFDDDSIARRLRALEAMRTVGSDVLEYVS
ncbi:serine hydrolase [Galbitalea sp. SE-J8]|uniref:serine hydrolase n=1 Tax=Galbitalea sp. SE-J8 TaxID=3054952 RepID=UPI00259CB4E7|nr:serine hydrolase [Galbitalea sp. SE-J8]MDM4763312.1 serine hydrolase [Galbitalea sp. SE-J8]